MIYWIMMFPFMAQAKPLEEARRIIDHSVPFAMLLIDFALNAVLYNPK
jgi:hypothetical protein